jgi:hypothetical protein
MPSRLKRLRLAVRISAPPLVCLALGAAMAAPASGVATVKVSVPCGGGKGGAKGLIAAIQRANARGGGTIELASGCTYSLSKGRFDDGEGPTGLPPIGSSITVKGHDSSIVRAKGAPEFRLFEVENSGSATLTISGLALRNGDVSNAPGNDNGAAILLPGAGALVVRGSTLSSNSAVNGGAISAGGAAVKIVNSTLRGNTALLVDGGGGAVQSVDGPLRIDSSVITNNKAAAGGGGVSGQSTTGQSLLKITDSAVTDNVSKLENGGGGVSTFGNERLVIRRTTIADNSYTGIGVAGAGGGIRNTGEMTITDSTISGNVAGGPGLENAEGGGIFNASGGKGTISATTIAGNRALGPGAAGGGIANESAVTLKATIVAANRSGNCLGRVVDGGFDLEDGHSCGFAKHAVKANPRLASLADNGGPTKTMALKRGSPAIKRVRAKSPVCAGTVDQRGVARPQGPRCDIGAFEVVATKTSLRVHEGGKSGQRVRLTATVTPRVVIPGPPAGMVVFRDRGKLLAKRRLDGKKPDTTSFKVRLKGGKHRLTASYKGSRLFLPS